MLKIYSVPISLYCAKLRIVLHHKKLEWEEVPPPGGYGSQEYKALVPAGNLPALEHGGLVLGDSEAIAEYLNETYPTPRMLPENIKERAKTRELSRFHDTRIEPALRLLFPHMATGKREPEFVSRQWAVLREKLVQAEPLLPTKPGELTLGDCGFPITCVWIEQLAVHFDQPAIVSERMQMYLDQLLKHEAVAMELADYRPKLTNWLSQQ